MLGLHCFRMQKQGFALLQSFSFAEQESILSFLTLQLCLIVFGSQLVHKLQYNIIPVTTYPHSNPALRTVPLYIIYSTQQ